MITYIPFFILSFLFFRLRGGLYLALISGGAIQAVGGLLRWLGSGQDSFVLLFSGQLLSAVAQVFILGVPPRIAAVWFPANERGKATAVGVTANTVGIAIGFLLSPYLVRQETLEHDLKDYLFWQFIACLAVWILCITVIRPRPPNPPR
jgi:FLVCR family feline leukemia virus subgroup C receptor-related protein